MSWVECYRLLDDRFSLPEIGIAGMDCRPELTISDLSGFAGWLVTYPSDGIITYLGFSNFLELGDVSIGATWPAMIFWFIVFCVVASLLDTLKHW